MSKSGRQELVVTEVGSVGFGVFSVEEIHAISVKRITSHILFDNLKNAVKDGLYDDAMGPMDGKTSCKTCRLSYSSCPGHFGHVDLALPVYNPLLFPVLFKLLQRLCFNCHHFKMKADKVEYYKKKLLLISKGLLVDALSVKAPKMKETEGDPEDMDLDEEDVNEGENMNIEFDVEDNKRNKLISKAMFSAVQSSQTKSTMHTVAAAREVILLFLEDTSKGKCANCAANNPTLRREGYLKVFLIPPVVKHQEQNAGKGICFPDVLAGAESGMTSFEVKGGQKMGTKQTSYSRDQSFLSPAEVEEHLRRLWANEKQICNLIWGNQQSLKGKSQNEHNAFFLRALLVPPNRFRPPNQMGDLVLEHPQNMFYVKIIQANMYLVQLGRDPDTTLKQTTNAWLILQNHVNCLLDSSLGSNLKNEDGTGVRQLLEKKEGLFRMNMMGKRVDHACRSVISPDPYLQVNEIGIPPYFATRLSIPVTVTDHNQEWLRQLVRRGSDVHPGAISIEDEYGVSITLKGLSASRRDALAKGLTSAHTAQKETSGLGKIGSTHGGQKSTTKVVYRHLMDGDWLLVNRQPTLHKPGIMGHSAKILKGEKTLRMHYANCNVYNADFDGDEMNVHFPQDLLGQAEAMTIANADEQYIVPTSGTPCRGLIQDHIVSATTLTMAGTLLTKEEFQQLLYASCVPHSFGKLGDTGSVIIGHESWVEMLPPSVLKPVPLWTGKQVVSAILQHMTKGQKPMNLTSGTKVTGQYWGNQRSQDTKVIVRNSEMLTGVLDKSQFGKWGIVHSFHELYGAHAAGQLLSSFSRLFTTFLQMHGFTCGIDDLLLIPSTEKHRAAILNKADSVGARVHSAFVGIPEEGSNPTEVRKEVARQFRQRKEGARAQLDNRMTGALSKITTETTNDCLPDGLFKLFPYNCMSMMTVTGAKGSNVNFNQIAALLGQQELEGKRVPRMPSGKTLPCFAPWDTSARAGGYISDRFLSGLRPQEYYFHCMAGREGLVDTTVKTSRSGYLQRCLIKNLEGLRVHYDYTVRDSDSSVIQFRYGSDGLDSTRTSYLNNFDFMLDNISQLSTTLPVTSAKEGLLEKPETPGVKKSLLKSNREKRKSSSTGGESKSSENGNQSRTSDLDESLPEPFLGAVSETYETAMTSYLKNVDKSERKGLRRLMQTKYLQSLADPGEPVGVLAAQSIGEPSTQMTLNTFHFAGRGEANVTLGIPRLREILMTAAKQIATPVMECPLLPGKTRKDAERVAGLLRKLSMAEILKEITVRKFGQVGSSSNKLSYSVRIAFYELNRYPDELGLTFEELSTAFQENFMPKLLIAVKKAQARSGGTGNAKIAVGKERVGAEGGGGEGGGEEGGEEGSGRKNMEAEEQEDDDDVGGEEEGYDAEKQKGRFTDEHGYEDEGDEDDEDDKEEEEGNEEKEEETEGSGGKEGKDGRDSDGGELEMEVDDEDDKVEEGEEMDEDEIYLKDEPMSERGMREKEKKKVKEKRQMEKEKKQMEKEKKQMEKEKKQKEKEQQEREKKERGMVRVRQTKAVANVPQKKIVRNEQMDGVVVDEKNKCCTVSINLPLDASRILLHEIVEQTAAQVFVRSTKGIDRCLVLDGDSPKKPPRIQIEGLNIEGVAMIGEDDLDLSKLTTNHIGEVLLWLGVEAARATILSEVQRVFGMYGINVDSRHVNLIAEFMTQGGGYRACNRGGMESCASPFQKMSFETAMHFLTNATLGGQQDSLDSPSSRIVLGRIIEAGTGSFGLLQNISL